ncbi:MAG: hypothetical protein RBT81_12525 [Gammaproteobacteria bacterium]|nr:hypothetical protein [Gammaproteobacteria bacterium]
MPELISQREYARRRGINHVSVHRAIKAGRITTIKGKIDPSLADRQWQENTDQSKPRNSVTGKPNQSRPTGSPSEPMAIGSDDDGIIGQSTANSYARARAARELYQAQLSKLELDRKRGTLVRADEVRLGAFNMARKARDQLIALPERLAAVLAAIDDPIDVQYILEEEIERICQEVADDQRP